MGKGHRQTLPLFERAWCDCGDSLTQIATKRHIPGGQKRGGVVGGHLYYCLTCDAWYKLQKVSKRYALEKTE
jgi:hypothetical protein